MSDLVARLAARAIGSGPGRAVPRPVPRFAGLDGGVPEDQEAGVVAGPTGGAAPDRGTADGWRRGDPPVSGATDGRRAPPVGRPAASGRSTPTPSVDVVASDDDRATDDGRPSTPGTTQRPPDPEPGSVAARTGPDGDAVGPGLATRREPAVQHDPGPDQRPRDGRSTGAGERVAPDDRSTPVVARPVTTEAPPTVSGEASDGPTIRIHIGRLEVRAAPAPSSPRPRSDPPGPDTSLAEYLRGHRGGR